MNDFYQEQKKKQRLKNIAAIAAAMILLLFVILFSNYIENHYAKDAAEDTLVNLEQNSYATLIDSGNTIWKYKDNGVIPDRDSDGTSWKDVGYDAFGWKSGKGTFGSDNGKLTTRVEGRYPVNLLRHLTKNKLSVPVYYFRTEFNIDHLSDHLVLTGTVQFDDTIVVYLNGEKVYSNNVPSDGFDGDGYGAEKRVNTSITASFTIENPPMLRKGRNVISVEVHQADYNSSDVYFDFKSLICQADKTAEIELAKSSSVILEPGDADNSVIVNWLTQRKGNYKLQFAKKESFMKKEVYEESDMLLVNSKYTNAYCYTAAINDMEVGEEYVYRIALESKDSFSKQFEYKCKDRSNQFSFLLAGDPQIGADSVKDDAAGWKETLDAGYALDNHGAAFMISAGDQIDSGDEAEALKEYYAFRAPDALKSLPIAVVRGNHETDNNLYDIQFKRSRQNTIHDYSFQYGNTLFVHINSNNDEFREHCKYLKESIKRTNPKWIVVMMHYSLFGSGPHANDKDVLKARDFYSDCFKDLNVDLVVSGHDHLYSRSFLMDGKRSTSKDGGIKKRGETMYLTGNSSSGSKFYTKNIKKYGYLAALKQEKESYVSSIKISHNEMIIATFDAATMDKIDYCKIKK